MKSIILFGAISLLSALFSLASTNITLRDSATGAYINGNITLQRVSDNQIFTINVSRSMAVDSEGDRYYTIARATGYRPLETTLNLNTKDALPVTIWLDPEKPSLKAEEILPEGVGLLRGFLYDANGEPIAGASLQLELGGFRAQSDDSGYYELYYEALETKPGLPALDNLIVTAPNGSIRRFEELSMTPGTTTKIEDFDLAVRTSSVNEAHKMVRLERGELDPSRIQLSGGDMKLEERATRATLPSSIRVGTSCSCTSCSYVSTMSLETYVQRGLDEEWISSWGAESLKSGAVAYRSYGAWYAQNPLYGSYDICSSTCCQVYNSDTPSSTVSAASATSGKFLVYSNNIFRSEYSAENNSWDDPYDGLSCVNGDLSCGNGYVGSPNTSWPCLYDAVATNHGCFGHGRGMSQWGTYRWDYTYGKDWRWITNHYYNASGNGSGLRNAYLNDASSSFEVIVDDLSASFYGPSQYWYGSSAGYASHMYYTYAVSDPNPGNYVIWNFSIPSAGYYEVAAYVPNVNATSKQAKYQIYTGSTYYSTIDQSIYYNQWVTLGTYWFNSGSYYVRLNDNTGESISLYRQLGVDAIRVRQ